MSRETCLQGLRLGLELAAGAAHEGYRCLGTGEMGIANSTAGTALYCALLGLEPEDITGPGAGSDPAMVRHKAGIVREALRVNAAALASADPVTILAAVGGFEIAVMSGIMLGAAAQRLPVLVDGFICSAAYVAAGKSKTHGAKKMAMMVTLWPMPAGLTSTFMKSWFARIF